MKRAVKEFSYYLKKSILVHDFSKLNFENDILFKNNEIGKIIAIIIEIMVINFKFNFYIII